MLPARAYGVRAEASSHQVVGWVTAPDGGTDRGVAATSRVVGRRGLALLPVPREATRLLLEIGRAPPLLALASVRAGAAFAAGRSLHRPEPALPLPTFASAPAAVAPPAAARAPAREGSDDDANAAFALAALELAATAAGSAAAAAPAAAAPAALAAFVDAPAPELESDPAAPGAHAPCAAHPAAVGVAIGAARAAAAAAPQPRRKPRLSESLPRPTLQRSRSAAKPVVAKPGTPAPAKDEQPQCMSRKIT